jgi:hypothetical protein
VQNAEFGVDPSLEVKAAKDVAADGGDAGKIGICRGIVLREWNFPEKTRLQHQAGAIAKGRKGENAEDRRPRAFQLHRTWSADKFSFAISRFVFYLAGRNLTLMPQR